LRRSGSLARAFDSWVENVVDVELFFDEAEIEWVER
jgi:hypothetical protein